METTDEQVYHPEKHNSSDHGFRVEIRSVMRPQVWGDHWIGPDWQRLPTLRQTQPSVGVDRYGQVANGLPASSDSIYDALTDTHSYMGAIALAASVMAAHSLGLECRLVEYKRTITYEVHRTDDLPFPGAFDAMVDRNIQRREKEKKDG